MVVNIEKMMIMMNMKAIAVMINKWLVIRDIILRLKFRSRRIFFFYFRCVKFCLQGYNAIYSVEIQLTFRRNISPPSSVSKNKPSNKPA
jgi:hypothetical protein